MSHYFKNRKNIKIVIIILMTLFFFSQTNVVFSQDKVSASKKTTAQDNTFSKDTVDGILGNLASFSVSVGGALIGLVIGAILDIASYNNFVNQAQIIEAWRILRDFCNMLFILALLIIAFASILRLENYSMKRYLPKIVIMAVLINFSRTIIGIFIDASQIIMLTFVNAFSDAGGNFVSFLQIDKFISIMEGEKLEWQQAALTYALVLIFVIIVVITMLAVLLVFVMRVIFLWIYVVLSPLAFLLMAFPKGERYASQYWSELTKYLVNGPVLAFFIWLALSVLNNIDTLAFTKKSASLAVGATLVTGGPGFMAFVLAIAFLVGGLVMSSQVGGVGASWGAGVVSKFKNTGVRWAQKPVTWTQKGAVQGTKGLAGYGSRKFAGWEHGFEIRPTKIMEGIKASMAKNKERDELAARAQGSKRLNEGGIKGILGGWGAGTDTADRYVGGFLNLKGFKNMKSDWKGGNVRAKLIKEAEEKEKKLNEMKGLTTSEYNSYQEEYNKKNSALKNIQEDIRKKERDPKSKVVGSEEQKELSSLIKQEKELQKSLNNIKVKLDIKPNIEKDKIERELQEITDKIKTIHLPKSFEARAAYRKQINEEKSKLKDVTNAGELLDLYRDAADKKDKIRVAAISEKLFNDANGNELLNENGYESNAVGLHKFIQEKMIKDIGMSKEDGLQLQSDLSEAAERVNHWEMAKTVGVNQYGELTSLIKKKKDGTYDDTKHAEAAVAEIFKMDPQAVLRNLNRLAFGGEDPKNNRKFNISTLGLATLKGREQDFINHKSRMQVNTAFNLASVEDDLRKAGISEELIKIFKEKGISDDGSFKNPGNIIEEIKKKQSV